jgi:hypothetical protein
MRFRHVIFLFFWFRVVKTHVFGHPQSITLMPRSIDFSLSFGWPFTTTDTIAFREEEREEGRKEGRREGGRKEAVDCKAKERSNERERERCE